MERKSLKSLFLICLVLGLLVGQSAALKLCFVKCFAECILLHSAPDCTLKCAGKCNNPPPPPSPPSLLSVRDNKYPSPPSLLSVRDNKYYCTLGCASSLCTHLVTQKNNAKEKVDTKEQMDGCVDSCAKTCSKN